MNHENGITGKHLLLAFLAGAVAGAVVAALSAPASGSETRERLRGWASDAHEHVPATLRGAYARASAAARRAFADTLDRETPQA